MPKLTTPNLSDFESRLEYLQRPAQWHEEHRRQVKREQQLKDWAERHDARQMQTEVEQAEAWGRMYAISDAAIRDALTLIDMQDEMLDAEDLRDTQECAV